MRKKIRSVRAKLFLVLSVSVLMIIFFLVIINSYALESYYYYTKKNSILDVYEFINENIDNEQNIDINFELEKLTINNNFDIVIKNDDEIIYSNGDDFSSNFGEIPEVKYDVEYTIFNQREILYSNKKIAIRKIQDKKNGLSFMLLSGNLDNGNKIYIRMTVNIINEGVSFSNRTLYVISLLAVILGGFTVSFITERFTKPIEELNDIANKMANLDFSKKYIVNDNNDELDELR